MRLVVDTFYHAQDSQQVLSHTHRRELRGIDVDDLLLLHVGMSKTTDRDIESGVAQGILSARL